MLGLFTKRPLLCKLLKRSIMIVRNCISITFSVVDSMTGRWFRLVDCPHLSLLVLGWMILMHNLIVWMSRQHHLSLVLAITSILVNYLVPLISWWIQEVIHVKIIIDFNRLIISIKRISRVSPFLPGITSVVNTVFKSTRAIWVIINIRNIF